MKQAKNPTVYILASERNGTLYVGVTSNLAHRMSQHAEGLIEGFTRKYSVQNLVYHSRFPDMESAIKREKQIKEWKRTWKLRLIEQANPEWINLYDGETGEILSAPIDVLGLSSNPVHD